MSGENLQAPPLDERGARALQFLRERFARVRVVHRGGTQESGLDEVERGEVNSAFGEVVLALQRGAFAAVAVTEKDAVLEGKQKEIEDLATNLNNANANVAGMSESVSRVEANALAALATAADWKKAYHESESQRNELVQRLNKTDVERAEAESRWQREIVITNALGCTNWELLSLVKSKIPDDFNEFCARLKSEQSLYEEDPSRCPVDALDRLIAWNRFYEMFGRRETPPYLGKSPLVGEPYTFAGEEHDKFRDGKDRAGQPVEEASPGD